MKRARGAVLPGKEAGLGLARSAMSRFAPSDVRWHYEHGLFLSAVRAAGAYWEDDDLVRQADFRIASLVRDDGSIVGYSKSEYNLDQINPGKNLFPLLAGTGDGRYRIAIDLLADQLRSQPRTKSGGYWHKLVYPEQIWLDGLYMAQPFRAALAALDTDAEVFEDIVMQLETAAEKTRDPITGLLRHAWDESRTQLWADEETGRSPNAWGRAMGWYAMALVDVLDFIPVGEVLFSKIAALLEPLARALERFQDEETGLWYQVVDMGGREGNYLEASVSSMLSYAFAKAVRLGALPVEPWRSAADRACEGLVERFLRVDDEGFHLEGTCAVAGLGGSPYRDGSYDYYVGEPIRLDDFKGIGPFILAQIEYARSREDPASVRRSVLSSSPGLERESSP
jgi:unsaturated rhamnogalacturonyl hydrolase